MTTRWRSWIPALLAATLLATPAAAQDAKFKLKPGAAGKVCLSCHADFEDVVAQPFVHTPVKSGKCVDCHSPHASDHGKLLEEEPDRICATCHQGLIPKDAKSVHAPVLQGKCVKCHDPHASKNKDQLRLAGNALCVDCHKDVGEAAEKSAFKHAPVQKNCLGCHDPHASQVSTSLLAKAVPDLCVGCHNPSLPIVARAHGGYPVAKAQCTSCHDPHGSGNSGILWASVHKPVANRACAQCHEEATSADPTKTRKSGSDLCRGCHNDLYNETFAKNRIHWPVVDAKACSNCHSPHAAKTAKLLKAPPKVLCGTCHGDAVRRQEKSVTKHPPIEEGDCATCHAPHSSDTEFLFVEKTSLDVCSNCHDWQKHSAHPIGEKAIDPRNRNLTVDCLSCHRTHGSPFQHFTHFDSKAELCTQCHTQMAR